MSVLLVSVSVHNVSPCCLAVLSARHDMSVLLVSMSVDFERESMPPGCPLSSSRYVCSVSVGVRRL